MLAHALRFLSVFLWANFIFAHPAASADRVALVIGNGAYQHASALPNPVNDAADISEKLKSLGFEVYGGNDLDLVGMQGAMRQFAENSPGAKVVLFFYAGHGMEVNGKNYLIPVDAKLEAASALAFEVVDANFVLNIMVEEKRIAVALLDACRDNPLARSFRKKSRSTVGSGLADVKVDQVGGGGLLYGLATGPGDTAADGEGRNSPFTKALLKHIGTPGVEFEQMMKSVKRDVDTETKGDQRPYLTSSLVDDLFLVPAKTSDAATTPEVEVAVDSKLRVDQEWELVKNSKSLAVLSAFLKRHKNDALYSGLAEERMAELGQEDVAEPKVSLADSVVKTGSETPGVAAITEVKVATGSFIKDGKEWYETDLNGQRKFSFTELGRNDVSIMLADTGRDMELLFDVPRKKVFFRVGNADLQPLYDIESVSSFNAADKVATVATPPINTSDATKAQFEDITPKMRTVAVGKWPEGLAFGIDNELWVAESGARQIIKIDLSVGDKAAKFPVGRLPVSMTQDTAGNIYAGVFTDGKLWRQPPSGKGKSIWQLPSKAHVMIDIAGADDTVFVAHYADVEQRMTSLTRVDAQSGKATTSEPFIGEGRALEFAGNGVWLLMANGSLARYDRQTLEYTGGADSQSFLWSMAANQEAIYTGGKTAQTAEGQTIISRHDLRDANIKIEKTIESNELIMAMAATDRFVAALGENGTVWTFNAADLTPLQRFTTGAPPRSAVFHNGQLFVVTHQGNGENGSLLIFDN